MNKGLHTEDELTELRALIAKVDSAVEAAVARAGDQITCHAGCASCCVDGLTVLPVEAHAIAAHVATHGLDQLGHEHRGCAFLDEGGRCAVYAARPLLCRTHGVPLRMRETRDPGNTLPIVDDISVCRLNFTDRRPVATDALDAERLQQLLVVVDRRFRMRTGLSDDDPRIALRDLAEALVADDG
jgi:hypothetical protein